MNKSTAKTQPVDIDKASKECAEAFIYGYPLVLMDVTRQVMTAVSNAGQKSPINQFGHMRAFPDYTFTDVVSPNADTLYSTAWLDLKEEPMILSVPEMGDRYYLMPMLGGWTNVFASPGTRTSGNGQGDFAIVGPQWKGTLPENVKEIKSPTNMVWIIGRTQTNGEKDFAAVNAIQDKYKLTPMSSWGKEYNPPANVRFDSSIDTKTPPVEQVARMDATTFMGRLNALMKDNQPATADAPILSRFASIGVAPGKPFDLKGFDPAIAKAIEQGIRAGLAMIVNSANQPHGEKVNGWNLCTNTGIYGPEYLWRAVVALFGLGANLPKDAIYPKATVDADGQPLNGANRYSIRFPKGQLPPVNAFWSLTMYNTRQFFVQNPINRYAIGDRDELTINDDGSLTIYVQHQSPGKDKESNWLPAPSDSFNVFMRLYWPKKEIVEGAWKMPPVEKIK